MALPPSRTPHSWPAPKQIVELLAACRNVSAESTEQHVQERVERARSARAQQQSSPSSSATPSSPATTTLPRNGTSSSMLGGWRSISVRQAGAASHLSSTGAVDEAATTIQRAYRLHLKRKKRRLASLIDEKQREHKSLAEKRSKMKKALVPPDVSSTISRFTAHDVPAELSLYAMMTQAIRMTNLEILQRLVQENDEAREVHFAGQQGESLLRMALDDTHQLDKSAVAVEQRGLIVRAIFEAGASLGHATCRWRVCEHGGGGGGGGSSSAIGGSGSRHSRRDSILQSSEGTSGRPTITLPPNDPFGRALLGRPTITLPPKDPFGRALLKGAHEACELDRTRSQPCECAFTPSEYAELLSRCTAPPEARAALGRVFEAGSGCSPEAGSGCSPEGGSGCGPEGLEEENMLLLAQAEAGKPSRCFAPARVRRGMRWRELGTRRPPSGIELTHEALAGALTQRLVFSRAQLASLGLPAELPADSFIQVADGSYYGLDTHDRRYAKRQWREALEEATHEPLKRALLAAGAFFLHKDIVAFGASRCDESESRWQPILENAEIIDLVAELSADEMGCAAARAARFEEPTALLLTTIHLAVHLRETGLGFRVKDPAKRDRYADLAGRLELVAAAQLQLACDRYVRRRQQLREAAEAQRRERARLKLKKILWMASAASTFADKMRATRRSRKADRDATARHAEATNEAKEIRQKQEDARAATADHEAARVRAHEEALLALLESDHGRVAINVALRGEGCKVFFMQASRLHADWPPTSLHADCPAALHADEASFTQVPST